jgi:thiol:disulfide interchange protein DsbC
MIFKTSFFSRAAFTLAVGAVLATSALADEAQIRKNLPERFPKFPAIDEVSKAPIPGLYEVRMGNDVLYTDEEASHIIEGQIIDTRTRTNLTEARVNTLSAIDFAKLPLKDAVVWKTGTGARKMAVFSDPNCGYCKRLEGDIQKLKNVTVYTFLIPVLGADSNAKSRNIWCAKEKTNVWLDWMLRAKTPAVAEEGCDATAIERNAALGRKHRVNGTPAIVFTDNTRVPGAMSADEIEKRLTPAAKS